MNNKPHQTPGFGIIGIVVVIALVGVLGFVGWKAYGSQQGYTTQPAGQGGESQATINSDPADSNGGYFVIEEWGIKFKPVEGLDGLIYATRSDIEQKESGSGVIAFTTKELEELSPNCNADTSAYRALGTIHRTTAPLEPNELFLGKIDEFYYYYFGPQSTCSGDPSQTSLELGAKNKLMASLRSLEAAD